MRQLSERAAWSYLARRWDKPIKTVTFGTVVSVIGGCPTAGLCSSIRCLAASGRITYNTGGHMLDKIDAEAMRLGGSPPWRFLWPTTIAGARRRAAFCRRMAAQMGRAARAR